MTSIIVLSAGEVPQQGAKVTQVQKLVQRQHCLRASQQAIRRKDSQAKAGSHNYYLLYVQYVPDV